MNKKNSHLDLTVGPLHYRLISHDDWGYALLSRMRLAFDSDLVAKPHRLIHLRHLPLCPAVFRDIELGCLPTSLDTCVGCNLPDTGWDCTGHNNLYQVWSHPDTEHAFWTDGQDSKSEAYSFHLPWLLILKDILNIGGAVIHGGLALRKEKSCLFTAPPGGGKSTTLNTPKDDWQILSDDATLLWPNNNGYYLASPLPTWSVLIGAANKPSQIYTWQISKQTKLSGIMHLEKSRENRIHPMTPIDAAYPLYRACCEYPAVLLSRKQLCIQIFQNACALAKSVSSWQLQRTRTGEFWPLVEKAIDHD